MLQHWVGMVVEGDLGQGGDVTGQRSNVLLGSVEEAGGVGRRGVEGGGSLVGVVGMLGSVGGSLVVVEAGAVVVERRGVSYRGCSGGELGDGLDVVLCLDPGAVAGGREGERRGVRESGQERSLWVG